MRKAAKLQIVACHHALAEALHACIKEAGITEDRKGFLFRTSSGHNPQCIMPRTKRENYPLRLKLGMIPVFRQPAWDLRVRGADAACHDSQGVEANRPFH
jgi:hypothetical protein